MKQHRQHTQSGYILVLTLTLLTVIIVLTTQIFNSGTVYHFFSQTVVNREKAKQLALSGVQLAISQLSIKETGTGQKAAAPKTGEDKPAEPKKSAEQQLLEKILPVINRWQSFELREEREGVDGQLMICIMCEDGKININKVYNFETKKFVGEGQATGDVKVLLSELFKKFKDMGAEKDLFAVFEKLLKDRTRPFDEVTELFKAKEFALFKNYIFYDPPAKTTDQKGGKRPLYLTDLFTVSSTNYYLEPWLLSDSVCGLLDLPRASADDIKKRLEQKKVWLKEFKSSASWTTDWDRLLKPVYGKEFAGLPKNINALFNSQFAPKTFSVLSYGKVGNITQRVYTILSKRAQTKDKDKDKDKDKKQSATPFIIQKMYWI